MKKLNGVALVASAMTFVMLMALSALVGFSPSTANAQTATDTPGAAMTTAAATTAADTTAAMTTSAATTAAMTTEAATTASATTAVATTVAETTAPATTVATTATGTTAPATTAVATAVASATKAPNTGLPYYTPSIPAVLTAAALQTFDQSFKGAAGAVGANAKYDFFFTSDPEAKISSFYDTQMKTLGLSQSAKNSTNSDGLSGNAYVYTDATTAYEVVVLGPLSAAQGTAFQSQLQSGSVAANDTLVILVGGLNLAAAQGGGTGVTATTAPATTAAAPTGAPATGMGGINDNGGLNPLWLLIPLALLSAMSTIALVARRRSAR